ncbi:MAG: TatD family hydrolase, partial [Bacteroidota bacterium]
DLAVQFNKPIIIHCVRAHENVLALLQEKKVASNVIFHGYNRNIELAEKILRAGYHLSFGRQLMEDRIQEVLRIVRPDRFFLETDDASVRIEEIYQLAAVTRDLSLDALSNQIRANFAAVFGIQLRQ